MPNNTTKQDVIFPDNSVKVIVDILKKYIPKETAKEFFEKFQKGQESTGSIVGGLLKKVATQELLQKDIPSILKEKLNITAKKAKDLSKDLEAQVLSRVRPRERDITTALKNKAIMSEEIKKQVAKQPETIPKEKKSPIKDTYRESVEE